MRKWITLLVLGILFALPSLAAAQGEFHLATLNIKLWPEYDQPNMLVIYDFQLTPDATLPARVTFHIPPGVNVLAVASLENGGLVNASYEGPTLEGDWQTLTILVTSQTSYHFEYYAPLNKIGDKRQFSFVWAGDYAVDKFNVSVQQPPEATDLVGNPALQSSVETDGLTYHSLSDKILQVGEQFTLSVEYNKASDNLTVPSSQVQPSAPLTSNTTGRISINNYLPYIIGGIGLLLILGGAGYYFLWNRRESSETPRRRRRRNTSVEEQISGREVYCPQCGERARPGDRFCRICGTRLRQEG
jgi:hypothetical protein